MAWSSACSSSYHSHPAGRFCGRRGDLSLKAMNEAVQGLGGAPGIQRDQPNTDERMRVAFSEEIVWKSKSAIP